jgi:N-acetylneuraminic acid mutarotase
LNLRLFSLPFRAFSATARAFCKPVQANFLGALCLLIGALGFLCPPATAQTNEWTWTGGAITADSFGSYGTLGAPAPGNAPGARGLATTWTDNKGKLWLFGGQGFDAGGTSGDLNDMWEYNPSTNLWAWMGGSNLLPSDIGVAPGMYGTLGQAAAGNIPSGRNGAVTWTDLNGNLWLFGGVSYSYTGIFSYSNDLWEFNPGSNQWTWVSGSNTANQYGVYGALGTPGQGNVPGARTTAVSWVDSKGNLWLFGGYGYDSSGNQGDLNDLWEYNPSTNQWTWVGGSDTEDQASAPGTLQTPATGNVPGARSSAVGWTDKSGNFWLFGGTGALNDLWKYNPATHEWAWMSGNPSSPALSRNQTGVYGTLQVPDPANVPGSRTGPLSWTDHSGNLWMFGGVGPDSTGTFSMLNDLWEFNPATNQWAWMGGSSVVPQSCTGLASWCGAYGWYGALRTPAMGNVPGGRYDAAGWTDSKGNFWLLGGDGFDSMGQPGGLSDLWEFRPNSAGLQVAATPVISPGSGTYTTWQTVTITDTTPGATIQYLINGTPPALGYSGPITVFSTETIQAMASASGYANSNIATANYAADIPAAAPPTFSPLSGTYSAAQTVTISDTTPGATIYYAVGGTPTLSSAVYTGPITVSSPQIVEAMAVADGYQASTVSSSAYNIEPNQTQSEWTWMGGSNAVASSCYGNSASSTTCHRPGWYGTLGKSAAGNVPGGRVSALGWTDSTGKLWLFGGNAYDSAGTLGVMNDLWMFNPSTAQWTWMGGSNKLPCSSENACGVAGVYGTLGVPAAGNVPGGREWATGWTDQSGHFWLFGGWGYDANDTVGFLNDLWEFDPSTSQWTWEGGSSTVPCLYCGQPGIYGTLGIPAAGNYPGARYYAASWADVNGNFWIYGGLGYDARGIACYPDDLWEFSAAQKQWAWQGGRNLCVGYDVGYSGMYGALGVPAGSNNPWSLLFPSTFTDNTGHLWLFGGQGEDSGGVGYPINDVWEFYPETGDWAWESPNSAGATGTDLGVYGTLGNWNAANIPGGRFGAATWTDPSGNLWIFGGSGVNNTVSLGALNDLWEYKPTINEWAWMGGSTSYYQAGTYGTLGAPSAANLPGARGLATTWTDKNGNLWLFGGGGYDAKDGYDALNDLWQYGLSSQPSAAPPSPAATPTFSLAGGSYTSPQTVTLSDATPEAAIYYTTNGTTPSSASTVYSAPITVTSSETIQAVAVASGYSNSAIAAASFSVLLPPPPPAQDFSLTASPSTLTITAGQSGSVSISVTPLNGFDAAVSFGCSGLPSGTSCTFSPTTASPSGSPVSTTVTITASTAAALRQSSSPLLPGSLLALALGCVFWRKRFRFPLPLLLALSVAALCPLNGCGGGSGGSSSSEPSTPPQPVTATVMVTATSGSLQHTATFSLTVN